MRRRAGRTVGMRLRWEAGGQEEGCMAAASGMPFTPTPSPFADADGPSPASAPALPSAPPT
jgi:hypothetical protein